MRKPKKSRYTVIKGRFWIHYPDMPRQGPEPDGDTVTFQADDVTLVRALPRFSGRGPNINTRGNIPVRYEGIDALETHFRGGHQQLRFANAARHKNLDLLGFEDVTFFPDQPNKVRSVRANPLLGHVIANGIEANGRLLGLVYAGGTALPDGSKPFVDAPLLDRSVNAKLVAAGLAYVEPYDTMPISLIRHLRGVITRARQARAGMFPEEDVNTNNAAAIADATTLESLIMWPKLFRRLLAFFAEGNAGLGEFDDWIREDPIHRDDSLRLPDGEKANMHDTFVIDGNSLKLAFNPEDLLIAPDPRPMVP